MPEKPEPDSRTIAEGLRSLTIFFAELTQQDAASTEAGPPASEMVAREETTGRVGYTPTTLAGACEVWLTELMRAVGSQVSEDERSGISAKIADESSRRSEQSEPPTATPIVSGEIAGALHLVQGG